MKSRIVLQIHDELLIETAQDEIRTVKDILTDKMKHAADLRVSLEVEAEVGNPGLMPSRKYGKKQRHGK